MVSSSYFDHSSGGKGKRERQGVNVPNSILGYGVG